jgi:hypothetical protein
MIFLVEHDKKCLTIEIAYDITIGITTALAAPHGYLLGRYSLKPKQRHETHLQQQARL